MATRPRPRRRPHDGIDGDAELPDVMPARFVVPECDACAGIMNPHVVCFGENVPATVVGEGEPCSRRATSFS
jgi:NAD-dependent SIR2 family protein deacetylase